MFDSRLGQGERTRLQNARHSENIKSANLEVSKSHKQSESRTSDLISCLEISLDHVISSYLLLRDSQV